jgi:UDP-arabinose 4-epimerase
VKVLVTGAAGYVGSHACKALARRGLQPVGLDNLERAGLRDLPWGPLEVADTRDRGALDAILRRHRPEAVMHFAAYAYVGESVAEPGRYYYNNVLGTLTLLESLRQAGVGRFVFSSTCATYGIPSRVPLDEDHPQAPINPYGSSKLMVERILADFDRAHGLQSVALRYFNAAGADPDGEIGECHEPETHAIPLAIRAALGRLPRFHVFGTDYPTPDGSAIRDYVHVSDLADAHVLALEYLLAGGSSTALNLGTGLGHSVLQVVAAVEAETGQHVTLERAARRPGDPAVLVADAARARATLGWTPAITDLREIVRTAVAWERRRAPQAP